MKICAVLIGLFVMTVGLQAEVVNVLDVIGREEISGLTVEFVKGQQVPISFCAKGELLGLEPKEPMMAEVKETFYTRITHDEVCMSLDGKDWKPLSEFVTGSAGISLGNGLMTFTLDANVRAL